MFISLPIFHQILAITPVAFGNLMIGIHIGWLPPTLKKYKDSKQELSFTDEDCSWIVSVQYIGVLISCILFTFIVDIFGRNAVIKISAILSLLLWVSVAATKEIIIHFIIRLVAGISMGLSITIMPIYIAENSSPSVRGVISSGTALLIDAGVLFGCTVTTLYSYETSAYIFIAISVMNILSAILLREPAQHLLVKGHQREAENNFFWLRGRNEDTEKEFGDIKTKATEKYKFSFSCILNRYFQITCVLSILLYLTGLPTLLSLISIILMPTNQFSTNELSILFSIIQLIGAIISPFVIDCFRRRTLWIVSAIIIAIIHLFTTALFFAKEYKIDVPIYEWLLFGSITAYTAIFSIGMYPLGIIMRSELLPQRFRSMGTCISTILNSLTGSIVGYSFLSIASNFGIQINFIGYAISSLIILVVCYFYIPETRGMALTDIEKMLENSNKKINN